jgi:hypothetical protein
MQGKIREFRSSERFGIIKTSLAPLAEFINFFRGKASKSFKNGKQVVEI